MRDVGMQHHGCSKFENFILGTDIGKTMKVSNVMVCPSFEI